MIKTIYEDDYLLVVDKPSGLLTVPTPKNEKRTLTSILNEEAKKKRQNLRLYPCHRLDRDTSGLIIYAKSKKAQQAMMHIFRLRKVYKEYIAFVDGRLRKETGIIKSYISDNPRERNKFAVTNYKLIRQFNAFAQVLVNTETGRTNQIRIHFKEIGHPLLGERRFAFRKDFKIQFKRLALHASKIEFNHPLNNERIILYSSLPDDLRNLAEKGDTCLKN
ncbi:MAG: hypothetical protein COV72_03615 [Candidatus Omnitrophica bacterium CG11_big_fil_rev_8_21_14_0_20_42_13]|uniref:Pseudouridine synthase RsuA/RluA-like domain-containing protein n=1 Tax=Candidatus Ghiorseimicrobium undicola TaxID=1974746 RepID=A0A2H0LY74_9BACT|nr:MAG: hypothetical protein COV72_03615 [Candidatus Omnitrophica bacterium CG11_big_fil_rev_8_21_14_0_20_42_13]